MKKVFTLSFVCFCFAFIGLVLWAGLANADPPFPVPPKGGLPACQADLAACEAQPPAQVPQTGQTTCWDPADTEIPIAEIDCSNVAAQGQDGEVQAGVVPPSPRFTDNGDGTITDNLTGLVWLKNANCLGGTTTWQGALDFANGLYDGCPDCGGTNNDCGLSDGSMAGDWRLPNVRELASLIDFENFNPALPTGHPFMNFQSDVSDAYWSSTTDASGGTNNAWVVGFITGDVGRLSKTFFSFFVLPVRGGS